MLVSYRSELVADCFQFPAAFRGGLGIGHRKTIERIHDDLGNNQPSIFLVIGGNDIPGRIGGAGRGQASLISPHVVLPVFPFVNVREAEFPVFLWLIDTREETIPLFAL